MCTPVRGLSFLAYRQQRAFNACNVRDWMHVCAPLFPRQALRIRVKHPAVAPAWTPSAAMPRHQCRVAN